MSIPVNNPQRLLLALLVLYGLAALVLGYDGAPVEMGATKDVDAIIQLREVEALANDEPFWDARDAVNARFIRFLIEHDGITAAQMEPAFATVRMPDVIELHEAFARALPAVRAMLPG